MILTKAEILKRMNENIQRMKQVQEISARNAEIRRDAEPNVNLNRGNEIVVNNNPIAQGKR